MKKKLTLILFVLITAQSLSQSYFMYHAGGNSLDEALSVSVDGSDNTFATGYFSGLAQFDAATLSSQGLSDIFIYKLKTNGTYDWVISAGGGGVDRGIGIKADNAGNCYVTGYFTGTATFGSTTVTSSGQQDVFIAKYNATGVLQWVQKAGGSLNDIGNNITIDNNGNVFVTGQFEGTAQFGATSLTSLNNPSTGSPSIDVFTCKLNAAGSFLWAKKGSGVYTDRGIDIGCDPSGNVFITGSFSDTITFDQPHYTSVANAIFVVKYDASGNEQWFYYAGGGNLSLVYGLTIDNNNSVVITGDFAGSLNFFGAPVFTLNGTYPKRIFIAKINNAGSLQWAASESSANDVSSKDIAVGSNGHLFITGNFKCKFNSFADQYGQGVFHSAGYNDIFIAEYDTSGAWIRSQQYGGTGENYGYGIAVNSAQQAVIAGTSYSALTIPSSSAGFIPGSSACGNYNLPNYCNDPDYGYYCAINSATDGDVILVNAFFPNRSPFDFYNRLFGSCVREEVKVCISNCNDTISGCGQVSLFANTNTANYGPLFNYLWSGGSTSAAYNSTSSGYVYLTITSLDGCYSSKDTIYTVVHPIPSTPTITDSKGVNTNAITTQVITICYPDSVTLTAGSILQGIAHYWTGPGLSGNTTLSVTVNQTGTYVINTVDSFGCSSSNAVTVMVNQITPYVPYIYLENDPDQNDTIKSCCNCINAAIYDTATNACIPFSGGSIVWNSIPSMANGAGPPCPGQDISEMFFPVSNGLYHLTATITDSTQCGLQSFIVNKDVYFIQAVQPTPFVMTISGNPYMCPTGDTITLTCSTAPGYQWNGPGIVGPNNQQSILVNQPGFYFVSCTTYSIDSCSFSAGSSFTISQTPNPTLTMFPVSGVICPGDSVQLTASAGINYQWVGPSGNFGTNTNVVTVTVPGFYYCIVVDSSGCQLLTNTVELKLYATPYLSAAPGTSICPGSFITIDVVSTSANGIAWLPPLTGSATSQTISQPGTYSCNVSSCNILTQVSITITASNLQAAITASGSTQLCPGDTVVLSANPGMASYLWSPGGETTASISVYASGTYSVSVTDASGCTDVSSSVQVTAITLTVPVVSAIADSVCPGDTIHLFCSAISNATYHWSGPNGFTSSSQNPELYPASSANSGTYSVYANMGVCNTLSSSINIVVNVLAVNASIITNSPLCVGDTLSLAANSSFNLVYYWYGPNGFLSGQLNPIINSVSVADNGTYALYFKNGNCISDTVFATVEVYQLPPQPLFSTNEHVCEGGTIAIHISNVSNAVYQWTGPLNFSSTGADVFINYFDQSKDGYYVVVSTDHSCKVTDSIYVYADDCINIPNVFTPNNDGVNEYFGIFSSLISELNGKIINRWGETVFEFLKPGDQWNGKNKNGEELSEGTYYYIFNVKYKVSKQGTVTTYKGFVELLR